MSRQETDDSIGQIHHFPIPKAKNVSKGIIKTALFYPLLLRPLLTSGVDLMLPRVLYRETMARVHDFHPLPKKEGDHIKV